MIFHVQVASCKLLEDQVAYSTDLKTTYIMVTLEWALSKRFLNVEYIQRKDTYNNLEENRVKRLLNTLIINIIISRSSEFLSLTFLFIKLKNFMIVIYFRKRVLSDVLGNSDQRRIAIKVAKGA